VWRFQLPTDGKDHGCLGRTNATSEVTVTAWTSRFNGVSAITSSRSSRNKAATLALATARAGQKGFRLTLFGFDVDADYTYLTRQAVGRRIVRAIRAGA